MLLVLMKNSSAPNRVLEKPSSCRTATGLGLALLCLTAVGGGIWWMKSQPVAVVIPEADGSQALGTSGAFSAVTHEILQRAERGTEIHFYQLLNDRPGTDSLAAFAARVSALIDEMARASEGRISVKHFTGGDSTARAAALAEGLTPLRPGQNDPEFLGVVLNFRGEKVVLNPLNPKWEGALEFDLSRALARVAGGAGTGELVLNPAPVNMSDAAELRRLVPELDSLPLEQARQQLREAARVEYQAVVAEMQQQLATAQERFAARGDSAEARQELRQLQISQAERMMEIPRRTQAQLDLLARLKQ